MKTCSLEDETTGLSQSPLSGGRGGHVSPQTAVCAPYKQDAGPGGGGRLGAEGQGLWSGPFTSRLHLPDEDAGTGLSWRMAST